MSRCVLGVVMLITLCLAAWNGAVVALESQADLAKKPQWQRKLSGEDTKKAGELEKRIAELEEKDDYAAAIQSADELLALRMRLQGADHHEAVDAKYNLTALRKVAALDAGKRKGWRSAMMSMKEADQLEAKGGHAQALPIRRKILELSREVLGADHPATAQSYRNVASILYVQANIGEALPLFQLALEINRKTLGENHAATADGYNNVAACLITQGKAAESQPLFQKALEINRRVLGEDHPATAGGYNNVAYSLNVQGKAAEAQPLLEQALEINRRIYGDDHPAIAKSFNNVASNLTALGRDAEARPLLEKALEINRKVLGEDHPETAGSYNNLAMNLSAQGKAAQAQPLLQKALEIRRRIYGENHPVTAASYNNVAGNLEALGKSAEAQPLFQKSLEVYRRVYGKNHPDTANGYNNVAMNLAATGKVDEAHPLFRRALEIRHRILGENHPDTATSYSNVASNLDDQGKSAEAEPLHKKALQIRLRVLGENHPATAGSYNNFAANLNEQGKAEESQPLYQKALEIRLRVLGENHPDTAASYNNVASNLDSQGKAAQAQPLYDKSLKIYRSVYGESHPLTATSYNNVAFNLDALGKAGEAELLFQKALEIRRRVLGEDHPLTASSYKNGAANLAAQGKTEEAKSWLKRAVFAYEASRLTGAAGLERASLGRFNPRLHLAVLERVKEPLQAWGEIERSLARGLLDQQTNANHNLTPAEVVEWTRERDRRASVQPQILALVTKSKHSQDETARLDTLLIERRDAGERLAALAVAASTREVASNDAIRAALPATAALLMWVDVDDGDGIGGVHEHWACVVRATGDPQWVRLPGTGKDNAWSNEDTSLPIRFRLTLAASAEQAEKRGVGGVTADAKLGSRAEVESLAKQLHAQRMAPILKHLAGVKTLYVVPADEMAGVPIEVLTADYTISYVPSGTYLARMKDRPQSADTTLLALGDPNFANPNLDLQNVKPQRSSERLPPGGLLIKEVVPGGAAAKAKLMAGDVLLKYGDVELTDLDALSKAIAANATAKSVTVTIWRESVEKPFTSEVEPGRLGVGLDPEPAPVAIANLRQTTELLAKLSRGGDWNALPGTRVETTRLKQLFGDGVKVLTDGDASEQSLESLRQSGELAKYRYLHFATHGQGNNSRAFDSALILAQDQLPKEFVAKVGEPYLNGQLSAREVLDFWKLNAELVTLSACESAIGKPGGGDGLLGFAQAFLNAGSRSVCLSLWKVDDTATALLMSRFYENLLGKREGLAKPLSNMGKAAALDEAKRWLRSLSREEALALTAKLTSDIPPGPNDKGVGLKLAVPPADPQTPPTKDSRPFEEPKYWAAFILIGDPN